MVRDGGKSMPEPEEEIHNDTVLKAEEFNIPVAKNLIRGGLKSYWSRIEQT